MPAARPSARAEGPEPPTEHNGFALFQRALVDRDEGAWDALYACYAPLVRAWIRRSCDRPGDVEDLVNAAFTRLWHAIDTAKFARFCEVGSLLKYLQLCAHGAVIDERRTAVAWRAAQLLHADSASRQYGEQAAQMDPERGVACRDAARELWEQVQRCVPDERERLVLRLSFVEGLPPRTIFQRHGNQFGSIDEVYRVKFAALERLRQDPVLQRWRASP